MNRNAWRYCSGIRTELVDAIRGWSDGAKSAARRSPRHEYTVLIAPDPQTLVDTVNRAMAEGWAPAPGLSAALAGATLWAQAMTRSVTRY